MFQRGARVKKKEEAVAVAAAVEGEKETSEGKEANEKEKNEDEDDGKRSDEDDDDEDNDDNVDDDPAMIAANKNSKPLRATPRVEHLLDSLLSLSRAPPFSPLPYVEPTTAAATTAAGPGEGSPKRPARTEAAWEYAPLATWGDAAAAAAVFREPCEAGVGVTSCLGRALLRRWMAGGFTMSKVEPTTATTATKRTMA